MKNQPRRTRRSSSSILGINQVAEAVEVASLTKGLPATLSKQAQGQTRANNRFEPAG